MMTSSREDELRATGSLTVEQAREVWDSLDESRGALVTLWETLGRKTTFASDVYEMNNKKDDGLARRLTAEALANMHMLKGIAFSCGYVVLRALRRLKENT